MHPLLEPPPPVHNRRFAAEGEENGGANGGKPGTFYVTSEKSARLKDIARSRGLWNFFLPEVSGVTVMEYSPIAGAHPSPPPPPSCRAANSLQGATQQRTPP